MKRLMKNECLRRTAFVKSLKNKSTCVSMLKKPRRFHLQIWDAISNRNQCEENKPLAHFCRRVDVLVCAGIEIENTNHYGYFGFRGG